MLGKMYYQQGRLDMRAGRTRDVCGNGPNIGARPTPCSARFSSCRTRKTKPRHATARRCRSIRARRSPPTTSRGLTPTATATSTWRLQLAQTAKAQLPNRHEVDDTLGWIYYKKGLSSMAVETLKTSTHAAARQPDLQLSPRARLPPERQQGRGEKAPRKGARCQDELRGIRRREEATGDVDRRMIAAVDRRPASPAISRRWSASSSSSASCSTR